MDKKLEILVVEDTPENLAVAKEFYNSQSDLNVDYAMDRTTAISKLESKKYDGVITDLHLAGFKDETPERVIETAKKNLSNYLNIIKPEKIPKYQHMLIYHYPANNGHLVALNAELSGIPWVICSEHGELQLFHPEGRNLSNNKEVLNDFYSSLIRQLEFKPNVVKNQEHEILEVEAFYEITNRLKKEYNDENLFDFKHTNFPLTKKTPESWKIALDHLKKRIAEK